MLCLLSTTALILGRSCDGKAQKVGHVDSEVYLYLVSLVARLCGAALMFQKSWLFALSLVSALGHVPRSRTPALRERLRVYPRHTARSDGQYVVSRGGCTLSRDAIFGKGEGSLTVET